MTSRKRRAEEPASSPRSYKQPRLSPQEQNASLSQRPNKMTTFSNIPFYFVKVVCKVRRYIWPSPDPSTKEEVSDEEYTVEATPVRSISPERIRNERHGNAPLSPIDLSPIEEVSPIPFCGLEGNLLSTPKGYHGPSSSITTTYSNTQSSSFTDDPPVENIDNIHIGSSYYSLRSSEITNSSFSRGSTAQSKEIPRKTRFRPRSKPHIEQRKFKATVRERNREAIKLRMYQVRKLHRELIDGRLAKVMNLPDYRLLLQGLGVDSPPHPRSHRSKSPRMARAYLESGNHMKRVLDTAKATINSPHRPTFTPSENPRKILDRIKDAAIEARLRGIPDNLPPKEEEQVDAILRKRGVVAKFAREQVSDTDLARLKPGQWLNDEIVNFYGAMILARSQDNKENAQVVSEGSGNGSLDVHYFSTFFWAKLTKDGYERGRLAKWTKKINIFSKDVILIPINHSNAHWAAAAINFRKKRIESYDSMGVAQRVVFNHLRAYLDAEHKDKKQKPFDFTGWVDIAPDNTPQQENGWDCGVFTCHFLEAISRGDEEFAFRQFHMPYLRRRMIWELGHAQLRSTAYK